MFSYKPLLHTMIEKDITKTQLCQILGCSKATIAKISKNEYMSMEILDKICTLLDCRIEDVIEHIAPSIQFFYFRNIHAYTI